MMKPRKPRRGKVPVTQSRPAPVQPSRSGSSRFYLSSTQNEEPRVPPLPEQPPPPAYSSDEEAIGCLLQFRASNENRRCLPTQQFAISQQPTGSRMPAGTIRTIPTGLPIPIQELQPMQPPQIPDQLRRERELAQGAGCCSAADCTNCSQNYCLSFDQSMPTFVFTSSEKGSGQPLQAAESAPDASFDRRRVAGKGPDEDIDHLTLQFDNFQLGDDEMNDKSTSEASADFAADDQNEDSDESVNVPEAFVDVPEEMENTKELASDIVDEWNAQLKRTIENVLNSDDDLDIPAEAQNVNVVPNVDVDCSSDVELNVAFNLATSVKKKIDKVQSLSSDLLKLITSHEDATNKPQEAAAKSEKAGSKVRGSNTPVISPSTSDSKRAADEQSSSLEKASSQLEGQKSDDGPGGTLSDASKRVAAVAAVIEQSKQRKILENERRTDFEKPQIQSVPSCRCDAGGNATSGPDPQIQSRPQNFPVQLQRSEPTELQLHLKKCQGKLCKNKYCWPMAQHLTHWLQCVAEDCAICRREADPTREGIKKEIMQLLGKEQATSNGIMDFLTPEGAAVILGYYVEYYFEVFLAYNELRKDRGLKAFEFPNGEVAPETVKEKVSHSCNCLPLANCRDKRCTRLRTILAHWSKWNGLCETNECQLCFRIYGRSRQVAADISPLIEPLRGQPTKAKLDNLKDKLMNMVKTLRPSSPDRKNGSWRNGLEESSRMNLKNGCVIVSILADAEHGELDGNTMENLDLASLFDQPIIYQLLMISKYIIYKAISFREKQLFDESPSMDIFLSMTMQSGVKIVRDVHMFVKTEFCCVEDPWDEGNATMRSCPMPVNKRYLMMMGRKMRNVMSLFATSNVDV